MTSIYAYKHTVVPDVPRNDIQGDRMVGCGGEDTGERGREATMTMNEAINLSA
jgi:hypothetical protein